jgi:hypothetical protein
MGLVLAVWLNLWVHSYSGSPVDGRQMVSRKPQLVERLALQLLDVRILAFLSLIPEVARNKKSQIVLEIFHFNKSLCCSVVINKPVFPCSEVDFTLTQI